MIDGRFVAGFLALAALGGLAARPLVDHVNGGPGGLLAGIVFSVLFESIRFFQRVPVWDFLFGLHWSPQTAIRADQVASSGAFGAVPLFAGTLLTGASASAGSFQSATIGPEEFGGPIPSLPYGAVNQNIAIRLEFTLTAGDAASFTSLFVVEPIPAPGAAALLGLGGLVGLGGRRRRA